jgi:hypothetical protein
MKNKSSYLIPLICLALLLGFSQAAFALEQNDARTPVTTSDEVKGDTKTQEPLAELLKKYPVSEVKGAVNTLIGPHSSGFFTDWEMTPRHSPVVIPKNYKAVIIPRISSKKRTEDTSPETERTIIIPEKYALMMVPEETPVDEITAKQGPGIKPRWHTFLELVFSLSILVFGAFIITMIVWIMSKRNKGWGPITYRLVVLVLIIVAGMFLITAGYSNDQITPVMGLLGTISGFLLGRKGDETEDKKDEGDENTIPNKDCFVPKDEEDEEKPQ